jgi:hypothetical protein
MAILQLMAGRGWSKAQTGRRFLVTDDTVASWNGRIEEDGPGALVDATVPVNKFPDFVAAMVTKLKRLFPVMGRRRIADSRGGRAGISGPDASATFAFSGGHAFRQPMRVA